MGLLTRDRRELPEPTLKPRTFGAFVFITERSEGTAHTRAERAAGADYLTYGIMSRKETAMRIGNNSVRPGELEAVREVVRLARVFGFGNLIAHLRRAWAVDLKKNYGGNYDQHLRSTDVDAYPESFDHFD